MYDDVPQVVEPLEQCRKAPIGEKECHPDLKHLKLVEMNGGFQRPRRVLRNR
jgi:hypothetical protein